MRESYLWPIVHAVVPRIVAALLGALIGLLGDAALLDGATVAALQTGLSALR